MTALLVTLLTALRSTSLSMEQPRDWELCRFSLSGAAYGLRYNVQIYGPRTTFMISMAPK